MTADRPPIHNGERELGLERSSREPQFVVFVDPANERAVHVYRRMGFETIDRNGNERRMRLSFNDSIVETVRSPPADRTMRPRRRGSVWR